jgi:hypothetical protein
MTRAGPANTGDDKPTTASAQIITEGSIDNFLFAFTHQDVTMPLIAGQDIALYSGLVRLLSSTAEDA